MKKIIFLSAVFLPSMVQAQTNEIYMDPPNGDSVHDAFWLGLRIGFFMGVFALIMRIVRQGGRQSPEI